METKDIFLILSPFIASYLTYFLGFRTKRKGEIIKFKEERYANLIVLLQGWVGNTASGETKKQFFQEYYKLWLYGNDATIKSIKKLIDTVMKERNVEADKGRKLIGEIVMNMRRDLSQKTNLHAIDFQYIDVIDNK